MKRLIILGFLSLFVATGAGAQEIFAKGASIVNIGVGLGANIPVEASYEYSVVDGLIDGDNGSVGIGGYLAYYGHSESFIGGKLSYNDIVIGARGAFHYQFVDKLDTYAGLMLGYDVASSKWSGSGAAVSASGSAFAPSVFVGARYYFTPAVGAYAEMGYGIAYLSVGVALRL
ncbi:MAG: hypothetical protein LBI58_02865 [Tannerellaceae bacterium]|jgi:hypothetical protein|nr:hypothetical protein [Tannerellaceae bacterium]